MGPWFKAKVPRKPSLMDNWNDPIDVDVTLRLDAVTEKRIAELGIVKGVGTSDDYRERIVLAYRRLRVKYRHGLGSCEYRHLMHSEEVGCEQTS